MSVDPAPHDTKRIAVLSAPESKLVDWLARLPASADLQVTACHQIESLLRTLHLEVFQLVLVDLDQAAAETGELCHVIHSASDLPLVLATSEPLLATRPAWITAGVCWAFSLGWDTGEVCAALEQLLVRRQRLRSAEATVLSLRSGLQSEQERLVTLTRAVREMNHEFKTPLAIVQGYCSNLLDDMEGPLTPGQRVILERMKAAAQMVTQVGNRLIEASGKRSAAPALPDLPPIRQSIQLGELAHTVVALFEQQYRTAGVALAIDVDPESYPVWGSLSRLEQVLVNLLANALRHTPAGGTVHVEVRPSDAKGRPGSRLTVRDTGCGIPLDVREQIFLPGWTSAPQSSRRAGLGLAICREVASEHNGRLWVDSEPGAGTTFHLVLPGDPRKRLRTLSVHLVQDEILVGQFLIELRHRSGGPVDLHSPDSMEQLADEVYSAGLPIVLLGPMDEAARRALAFLSSPDE